MQRILAGKEDVFGPPRFDEADEAKAAEEERFLANFKMQVPTSANHLGPFLCHITANCVVCYVLFRQHLSSADVTAFAASDCDWKLLAVFLACELIVRQLILQARQVQISECFSRIRAGG